MEGINLAWLATVLKEFGIVGLVIILWWIDSKKIWKVLERYKSDMAEIRRMYEDNVTLVEAYQDLGGDLKDVVIMNTQAMQRMNGDIKSNQYCPKVRLEKRARGKQG